MDITELKHQLEFAIPEELYDLEPDKVFFFVPKNGFCVATAIDFMGLIDFFDECVPGGEFKLNFFPTDNASLNETFAVRIPQGAGALDKVVIGTLDTLPGFAKEYLDKQVEDQEDVPSPIILSLDSKDCPVKRMCADCPYSDNGDGRFDTELLTRRPETDKEKEDLVANREQKIRKILWECAYLGIDIDINSIADEVEAGKSEASDYELSLKMKPAKAGTIDCKIFVREDMELVLKQPIHKAVYLTFLSLEDGLVIEAATPDFTKRIQKIYRSLPNREEKEEGKDGTGIMYVQYIQPKTLRGYTSEINTAIAKLIPNGLVAIEFSIEGEKEKAFKVMRSTPEIREQIISAFNL